MGHMADLLESEWRVPAALKYLDKVVRINASLPGSIEVVPAISRMTVRF